MVTFKKILLAREGGSSNLQLYVCDADDNCMICDADDVDPCIKWLKKTSGRQPCAVADY